MFVLVTNPLIPKFQAVLMKPNTKPTIYSVILWALLFNQINAQPIDNLKDNVALFTKIENLIISKKIDSVKYYIQTIDLNQKSRYTEVLNRFCQNKQDYNDYYQLAIRINNRPTNNTSQLTSYVTNIPIPTSKNKIELDYVYTYWLLISKLRNFSEIDKASFYNNQLQNYVQSFNQNEIDVKKANLLLSNHLIVLNLIEKKIKEGKELCISNLEEANSLNDKNLRIIFLNHLCDFLLEERNLEGFITNSELSLSLESKSEEKSPYYIQTLEKLIDAYIFKGGYNKRVFELLNTIYTIKNAQKFSYSLYANFLRILDKNSLYTQKILKKFKVKDYISFCNFIEKETENALDQNQFYFVIDQSSKLLESKGYLKEASTFKTKCVNLTRKIYSESLATSLANYRTEEAVKDKEIELTYEKEKSALLIIISGLSILILVILIFVIIKKYKQEKLLKSKNKEIIEQRDAIRKKEKEKDLLLKEVHHRVKNNFQIISSLLELQTKGIKDNKAREFANETKNRIKSMALIHQKLYQNNSNLINFEEYLKILVNELNTMYASNKKVETAIQSENIQFDVDTAIPLGLIINELITNAYKHAFNNNKNNSLNIILSKENTDYFKLKISDNGPGLNTSIDINKIKSIGLRLVSRLVKQLQGTLNFENDNGANFEILFKDTNLRKQTN